MAISGSGTLSLNEFHIEAGGTSGTECSINDSDIRGLIDKSSGATMSFNEWYGASAYTGWEVTGGSDGGTSGNFKYRYFTSSGQLGIQQVGDGTNAALDYIVIAGGGSGGGGGGGGSSQSGRNGGSGGGGAGPHVSSARPGGEGISGQGTDGGAGGLKPDFGGGGGGKGGAGTRGFTNPGQATPDIPAPQRPNVARAGDGGSASSTGNANYNGASRGGGGGGGCRAAQGGNPGTGGGEGASAAYNADGQQVQAQSGSSNTGGGGGGGAWDGTQAPLGHIQSSGAGGSGIVMVRYQFQSS